MRSLTSGSSGTGTSIARRARSSANVRVTVGAAEANFISVQALASPGVEVVVMRPNYMQIWGLAMNSGMAVRSVNLKEERHWAPDLDELADAVSERGPCTRPYGA